MQPFVKDNDEVIRFKKNALVDKLLKEAQNRDFGLNELACMGFPQADWEQFYQLIGYSLCGYHELSNVSDKSAKAATRAARKVYPGVGGCRDHGCSIHSGVAVESESE